MSRAWEEKFQVRGGHWEGRGKEAFPLPVDPCVPPVFQFHRFLDVSPLAVAAPVEESYRPVKHYELT